MFHVVFLIASCQFCMKNTHLFSSAALTWYDSLELYNKETFLICENSLLSVRKPEEKKPLGTPSHRFSLKEMCQGVDGFQSV